MNKQRDRQHESGETNDRSVRATVCLLHGSRCAARISRMPGVCPAVLQKVTKYVPATRFQPAESRTPTSHCGSMPPTSDATDATTPTSPMYMAVVTITSVASARARVTTPAKAELPTRLAAADGMLHATIEPHGGRADAPDDLPGEPRRLLSDRGPDFGAGGTSLRACCISSLASIRSVSSSVRGLASAALNSRSSTPLASSSSTTRSTTR